jgi:hypothetical protein
VAGPVLAAGPAGHAEATLTEHVTVSTLTGPYLPVAGWPAEIDASLGPGSLVGFDPDSGTLVTDAASLAGGSYTVTARGQPAYSSLADAAAGSGALFARYTSLPPVPAPLAALASQVTAAARTPYAKLTAINDYLRKLPVSRNAPPGDSYGALVRLLTARNPRGQAGESDQHASAFAILARIERIPARVMVGYRLPAGAGLRGRTYTLTTADAYAWAQAYFQGYGWISFDPTNTRHTVNLPAVIHVPEPASAPPRVTRPPTVRNRPHRQAPRSPYPPRTPVTGSRPASWPTPPQVAIPVLVLLLLSAALAVTMARRAVRRRRRHGGSPAMRAVGAWDEAIDRLADAGVAIAGSQTALELAARASQQKSTHPTREQRALALAAPLLRELAAIATEAAYSQTPPSVQQAERAWQLEGDLSKALYGGWRAPYRAAYWAIPRSWSRSRRRPRRRERAAGRQ